MYEKIWIDFFFPISTFFNKCISPTADLLSPWWQSNLINSVRISQIFFHSETAIFIYRNRLTWKRISNQHPKSITSFPKILFSWIWLISQSSRKLHISKITSEYKITKFTKKIPNEPTDRFGSSPQESVPLARAQLLPRTNTHTHIQNIHTHTHTHPPSTLTNRRGCETASPGPLFSVRPARYRSLYRKSCTR